ncbi:hypothetical protein M436DRAFT_66777 [Aureobasidium namibiae CBS 147.97]|uniref:Uncharacterized protein n=1 Tax=Aureobasidium namibiae CBS 147.97 TaxID=1043004 RepID=A0A074WEE7_9PEZI
MVTFELSHRVATGKQQAKQLAKGLKTLHRTLKDTNTDATVLQDLNLHVAKAQEPSSEAFLFIEKEAENARKITTFITTHTISEVVARLAKQAHLSSKSSLAVLVLRYYFSGFNGEINRKNLETRLKAAEEEEEVGSLGDFPWTSSFEDVMEKYRGRVETLAVEMIVEEVKGMVEREYEMKDEFKDVYLPYLYQRPVLSSGRKLTKEYALLTITLATDAEEKREQGFKIAGPLNPWFSFLSEPDLICTRARKKVMGLCRMFRGRFMDEETTVNKKC